MRGPRHNPDFLKLWVAQGISALLLYRAAEQRREMGSACWRLPRSFPRLLPNPIAREQRPERQARKAHPRIR